MARLQDPREPHRFKAGVNTYDLKVPALYDAIALKKALALHGARHHGRMAVLEAAREIFAQGGEAAQAALPALDQAAGLLGDWIKGVAGNRWPDTEEGRAAKATAWEACGDALEGVEELVHLAAAASPRLAAMRADDEVFFQIYGLECVRLFVTAWSGPDMPPFARTALGVPEELIARLPAGDVVAIGAEIRRLMEPTEAEAGNSVSPSRGTGTRSSSTAGPSPATADGARVST